ncbi:gamma-glutamyl-gamma-aminobutyrate hydrolase family protein [Enterococcus sp. BWB1-3]|uniref:gamma-glutamyl-gamma-aminobutyrate hydrolase family protein n=1 Tax=Enterococcus sp. BWB1-3 TaxID=2787713 RepID=UPI001920A40F|nr:gamma-glutamyl-gamma-aminobutyrate hydrolase family protein [Enterococcus sp. BWB1-3]MBL1230572.1 gamma-glutamyl-gamma-aminobutyrate hydrolase family protein [Enterococcus sp. BWB1-3]
MVKPIIGIAGNQLIHSTEFFHGNQVSYTPQGFVNGIQKAGGIPFILPIGASALAKTYINQIDKLLLAGGQDVSPDLYGEEPQPKLEETNRNRDIFELALITEAMKQKKPIFAVCRGMQLLNVALKGTLYQDLSEYKDWKVKHVQQPTTPEFATHSIVTEKGSILQNILGEKKRVNSYHHQAVRDLSPELIPTAYSTDGIIEGVEAKNPEQRLLAVQWHPELNFDKDERECALFDYFVNQL